MALKQKHILAGAAVYGMAVLTACSQGTVSRGETSAAAAPEQAAAGSIQYDEDDDYLDWSEHEVTSISFQERGIQIEGAGAAAADGIVSITAAGSYVLAGEGAAGQVVVDTGGQETVRLILNGLDLTAADSTPIYLKSAGKTVISLVPETVNTLTGGAGNVLVDAPADEPDGVIFANNDLTINGSGTLIIKGNDGNGITSKDGLKLMEGALDVTALHNGIKGRNYIGIKSGTYAITAGNDGIKSTNSKDEGLGFIVIEGGSFGIQSDADAIQAETSLTVTGGYFDIQSGGGSGVGNAVNNGESAKGLKAGTAIALFNGSYYIDSADDAIHSNGDVAIKDGYYQIRTGDDAIHGDSQLWISGGEIIIETCYEGLESSYLEISGGEIYINASDDGINVSGGSGQSKEAGRHGSDSLREMDLSNELHITGGYIVIRSLGDGLDANGSIYMSGGIVLINGPANGPDVAIDFDGSFEMTGGLIIGAGSSLMAQAPSETSVVNGVMIYFDERIAGGTLVSLLQEGEAVLSFAPENAFQNMVFASSDLIAGESYEIYLGGTVGEEDRDGYYRGKTLTGGELYREYEQTDGISQLGFQSGSMNPGRPDGQMPPFDGEGFPGRGGEEERGPRFGQGGPGSSDGDWPAPSFEQGARPEPPDFTNE